MINELHAIDYSRRQLSYYEMFLRWKESIQNLGVAQYKQFELYSAYGEAGYHNGMRMTEGMLQKLFNGVFMGDVNEEYMQGSFQKWYEETLAVDDTFKYANKIFVNIRRENRVQPYNCSITIMNGQGKVAMSRLKYTKSHDEMRPLLRGLREARENAGAPELKRLETDCPTADKSLYETIFPELKKGVLPYTPASEFAALSFCNNDEYRFFNTSAGVNNYILLKLQDFERMLSNDATCYYGLDGEWNRDSNEKGLALLQLSFRDLPVLVIHLHCLDSFPEQLKNILQLPRMIACGRNIGVDLARLEHYNVKLAQRLELSQLAKTRDPSLQSTSLKALTERFLGNTLVGKEYGQNADYEAKELEDSLITDERSSRN
jgi:hypothetical protein